jgi:hypothetical protein
LGFEKFIEWIIQAASHLKKEPPLRRKEGADSSGERAIKQFT